MNDIEVITVSDGSVFSIVPPKGAIILDVDTATANLASADPVADALDASDSPHEELFNGLSSVEEEPQRWFYVILLGNLFFIAILATGWGIWRWRRSD